MNPALPSPSPIDPPVNRRAGWSTRLHSGVTVARFLGMHWFAAIFPMAAGVALFGWRTVVVVAGVLISVLIATAIWRRIGMRGASLRYDHCLWLGLLLAMLLPAHLGSTRPSWIGGEPLWLIIPAAGLALVMFTWILGGLGSGRVHPVLLTYLLLVGCFGQDRVPHRVLQRGHVVTGDLMDVRPPDGVPVQPREPWHDAPADPYHDAVWREPASQRLVFYTSGLESGWQSLDALIRDRMPPLEDLIIGGQPGPIGGASGLAVIIGGLFLLYRGLIDWRIPLLMILVAYLAMLILPVPVAITDLGPNRHWFWATKTGVGWSTAITFINYQVLAGPLLLIAFFVATAPSMRPTTRRGCIVFALLAGVLAGAMQLYASVAHGPAVAVLLVSAITPWLDRWIRPRPLI